MNTITTKIDGVYIFEPTIHTDNRGCFYEGGKVEKEFVQLNHSISYPKVLRGLHYQVGKSAQSKLCWVSSGIVFDVFVDLRVDSKTYGQWDSYWLTGFNKIFIPAGCAHGFLNGGTETAHFNYLVDNKYDPTSERTLLWNDTDLNIEWPITTDLKISDKDLKGLSFKDCEKYNIDL